MANASARNVTKKTVDQLKKGRLDFTALADSLEMMIRSKPVDALFNPVSFNQELDKLVSARLSGKFTVIHVARDQANNSIVIAEAEIDDIIAGAGGNREVKAVYPCWIYIRINPGEQKIDFTSSFPQNKDHQYLLEDLSDELYTKCTAI
ncbi:MAG: hypothetical protein ABW019_00570 [Chitinophagaceae bacterium]